MRHGRGEQVVCGLILALWAIVPGSVQAQDAAQDAAPPPATLSKLKSAAGQERFKAQDLAAAAQPSSPAPDWLAGVAPDISIPAAVASAVEAGRYKDAYNGWGKTAPDPAKRPYEAYLRAWCAARAGLNAEALALAKKLPGAGDFLFIDEGRLIWLESAAALSQWPEVKASAAALSGSALYAERAVFLGAQAALKGGEKDGQAAGQRGLEEYIKRWPKGGSAGAAMQQLGDLYVAQGKASEAGALYDAFLRATPLGQDADAARVRLSKILAGKGLSAAQRKGLEDGYGARLLARLEALFDAHRSDDVVSEGAAFLKGRKAQDALGCEVAQLIGRSYTKLRKHADSVPWYERVAGECGAGDLQLRALYLGGRGWWNAGDGGKAQTLFERVWKEYPSHSYADDSMLYVARILREAGKLDAARKVLRQQLKSYPKGDMAADAHWLLLRELLDKKDWRGLIKYAAEVEDPAEQDLYTQGRLDYFVGRAHEHLKAPKEAREAYERVVKAYPMGYYALLSLHGLARIKHGDKAVAGTKELCALGSAGVCDVAKGEADSPVAISDNVRRDVVFKRGVTLLRLGMLAPADREFRRLRSKLGKDAEGQWTLAALLDAAGAYPLSHDIPRREIDGWASHYPLKGSQQRWEIAYPRPFKTSVEGWAEKRGIPPALVWAIMREESGFNPRIESWANARGLLQLMEATGRGVAKKDGLEGFTAAKLFEPEVNIRLGTAYMAELSGQLDQHPALIIAGYNGGYANVSRWLKEGAGAVELDLWVEDIPYGQTRNYTKRVLTSFWTYSWMYSEQAVPRLAFKLPVP
jgi:soluble lytic murein transglycosylase